MKDILIGVIASVIASFIWWALGQIYAIDSRKKINVQLMLLRNDNYSYQKFLEQRDYDLALKQCQRMLDEICATFYLIKPLTYFPRKRKLITTILNSLYSNISYFQRYYEGYEGDVEKERCCFEAARHLYVVGFKPSADDRHPDYHNFQSASEVSIELLSDLNQRHNSCVKILSESLCFNSIPSDSKIRKKFLLDMMNVNAYRNSYSKGIYEKFQLSRDVLTRQKYEALISSVRECSHNSKKYSGV